MFKSTASVVIAVLALASASNALDPPFYEPNTWFNRSGIVHLLEWKWMDIARECEEFLGPKGYGAVQVSPPTENVIVRDRRGERTWWERYQPISYRLISRSGNDDQFAEMTRRCNAVGVRVYVDLVINHMTADYPVAFGTGSATANSFELEYHLIPFTREHFHSYCKVYDYNNPINVRNCEVNGLHDLNHAHPHVRAKIVDLMNRLIYMGVAGFSIDSAKHIWPHELKMMVEATKPLNTAHGFEPNTRPFIYQDVKDTGNEAVSYQEYTHIGRVVDSKHSKTISSVFGGSEQLHKLRNWGTEWNLVYGPLSVVSVNNHDDVREWNGFGSVLTTKRAKQYKMAVAFMLAHPNAVPRVLSSYKFENNDHGIPVSASGDIASPFNPKTRNSFIYEHRWRQVYNMVGFRNIAGNAPLTNWWDNGSNHIAFSRGNKAFIVFNKDSRRAFYETLQTGLPEGQYCDIISGDLHPSGHSCTAKYFMVDKNGFSSILLHPDESDGMMAVHIGARVVPKTE